MKFPSAKERQRISFGLAIFISAFLLFQIQPLISRYILPWFGGGTSVWTTAQVFFQVVLLGGYAYAHGLSRLRGGRQGQVHLALLGVVAGVLVVLGVRWGTPVTPDASWKPEVGGYPAFQVLGVLAVSVGLPYFVLSTTSSLMQSWYSRMNREGSPYAFYVLSNAASLLALLSYPVVIEPNLRLREQALAWSVGFGVYLGAVGWCALQLLATRSDEGEKTGKRAETVEQAGERPGWGKSLLWIGLAACASTMSLAVTNQITQDVASVPFLWVLPLSLYLLSFIVGFNDWVARQRGPLVVLMLLALGVGLLILLNPWQLALGVQIAENCFVLFVVCLFCHSELYRDRPDPRYLTSFYLMLSIGGALGGVLVSLIAPLFFRGFWEFPLALLFCADLTRQMAQSDRASRLFRFRHGVTVLVAVLAVGIVLIPLKAYSDSFLVKRNFYGLLRVREVDYDGIPAYNLVNGTITHGLQAMEGPNRSRPTSYFTESSGAALAILNHPARLSGQPLKIGIIGLGVGTLAYYGQQGDTIRFYEINPQVIEVAQDTRYFTYLRDSRATVKIVEGDARLSLERELAGGDAQNFDIFVIDAFSGDSIPAHLLSIEALRLYMNHLKPDAVLVFHISNKYIALEPVLWQAQQALQISGAYIAGKALQGNPLSFESFWVLFTHNSDLLSAPAVTSASRELTGRAGIHLWTDDYGNLFQALK